MTLTSSDVYFDMYDRDLYASPYATYQRLRDEAPLYYNEQYNFFAVSRHEDAARVREGRRERHQLLPSDAQPAHGHPRLEIVQPDGGECRRRPLPERCCRQSPMSVSRHQRLRHQ